MAKTHKTTIFLQAPQAMKISELKTQALSALQQFAETHDEIPRVSSEDEFEISRAKRSKGSDTVTYEVMAGNTIVKDVFLNWEEVYLQFRDASGVPFFAAGGDESPAHHFGLPLQGNCSLSNSRRCQTGMMTTNKRLGLWQDVRKDNWSCLVLLRV